jgi:glycosyltransferase involved in cell wall biosynthesis/putative flippase GtrA
VIGGVVFAAGLALQAAMTNGLHVPSLASYGTQAVVSVEASFLLNRRYTWYRRCTKFWPSLLRFNVAKTVTIVANLVLYAGLIRLGLNYLLANVLLTVVFAVVNYVGGDRFVFTRENTVAEPPPGGASARRAAATLAAVLPTVSVVIPCQANEKTIRAAVNSLIAQDYPGLREIILVGSRADSTWAALEGLRDPRLVVLETQPSSGIRDANFKRDVGIRRTSGDLVSLIDSDMVLPHNWLSRAVTAIVSSEADCVAGVMRSIHDSFWGRFTDNCRLGAKTPRVQAPYFVTAEKFGRRSRKPPITANVLFTREVYQRCPIDASWSHGSLEDYEWFWRVVDSGHRVLVTDRLYGWHHHRTGLRRLAAEYRRSARGCAYFIRAHRRSPFARKRLAQAVTLPLAAVAALAGLAAAIAVGDDRLAGWRPPWSCADESSPARGPWKAWPIRCPRSSSGPPTPSASSPT